MAKQEYSEGEVAGALGVVDGLGGDVKTAAKRLGIPQTVVAKWIRDRDRPELQVTDETTIKSHEGTKFTEDRRSLIVKMLEEGNTRTAVCAAARIERVTFYRWLDKDDEFRIDCEAAEAKAEADAVENIRAAGRLPQTWQANAWLLERRSAEWKAPDIRALTAALDRVERTLAEMSPEARAEFVSKHQSL